MGKDMSHWLLPFIMGIDYAKTIPKAILVLNTKQHNGSANNQLAI
jgi:hypothetical protein